MANNASSNFIENRVINTYLRGGLTTASPLYIALYQFTPAETGETNSEPTGNAYMRMTGSGADIVVGGGGGEGEKGGGFILAPAPISNWTVTSASAANKNTINYPTATGGWGSLEYICLVSGSHFTTTGSNVYFYGVTQEMVGMSVGTGDVFSIPINSLYVFMAGAYSTYLGNNILNQYLNNFNVYQPTSNVKLALFITLPNRDGYGGIEVPMYTGASNILTGYQRKNVAGTDVWWEPLNGSASTLVDVDWGTASADWGYVEGVGIYETINNNLLFRAYLNNPRQVLGGDTFEITSGSMKVVLD